MIGRVLLAALLAGIVAGVVMGVIQHVRITPLILQAEVYENAAASHGAATETSADTATTPTPAQSPEEEEWSPADGWQRSLSTTVATMLTGAAFAVILAGISLLTGIPVTPGNGAIWGLCAFLAATLAPAAGLSPELPGMPAGDLVTRQFWWAGTILATGAALYLIATRREFWVMAVAVVLIALPHVIGAPQPVTHETTVPAGLAATYASNVIAAAAVFWSLIGVFLGYALRRFSKDIHAT